MACGVFRVGVKQLYIPVLFTSDHVPMDTTPSASIYADYRHGIQYNCICFNFIFKCMYFNLYD